MPRNSRGQMFEGCSRYSAPANATDSNDVQEERKLVFQRKSIHRRIFGRRMVLNKCYQRRMLRRRKIPNKRYPRRMFRKRMFQKNSFKERCYKTNGAFKGQFPNKRLHGRMLKEERSQVKTGLYTRSLDEKSFIG